MSSNENMKRLQIGVKDDIGKKSALMEDANDCFQTPAVSALGGQIDVAIVADGIGGQDAGEVASRLAIETIKQYFQANIISDVPTAIKESIEAAQNAILNEQQSQSPHAKMGCTVTLAVITSEHIFVGNVGDSRAYLIRNDAIEQISKDHTWVQEALDHGRITPEEGKIHPNRHVLRRYLGMGEGTLVVDVLPAKFYKPGDRILLCTDGLSDQVKDDEIKHIASSNSAQSTCEKLMSLALERGGFDNITVRALYFNDPQRDYVPVKQSRPIWQYAVVGGLVLANVLLVGVVLALLVKPSEPVMPTPTIEIAVFVVATPTPQPTVRGATAAPTVTPLPTFTPIPLTTPYIPPPVPQPLGPIDGQVFEGAGAQIILTWPAVTGQLPPDIYYVITLRKYINGTMVGSYEYWTKETKIQLPPSLLTAFLPHNLYRTVAWNVDPSKTLSTNYNLANQDIRFEWLLTLRRLKRINPDGSREGDQLGQSSRTGSFIWREAVPTPTPTRGPY